MSHQLIVLENPPQTTIEEIKVKGSIDITPSNSNKEIIAAASITKTNATFSSVSKITATIIKPSSLNYKVTLKQAAIDFSKKESKIENDQEISVIEEGQTEEQLKGKKQSGIDYTLDLDDAMFDMVVRI